MSSTPAPYFKKRSRLVPHVAGEGPWTVPDLCGAYNWPTNAPGGGKLAIVELGGGWTAEDMAAFFTSVHQPVPTIIDVSVDGTTNTPGGDADGEVALDIQVAAASYFVATGGKVADIRVYWARDIAAAIMAAKKDGCDVCSISWGADEANWSAADAGAIQASALAATQAGMVVLAASGDNDSSDGGPNAANVDLPSSAPSIIACGGTFKSRTVETVWNDKPGQSNGDGTGGGYSELFEMPTWQSTNGAPGSPPDTFDGKMVPDIAAAADPSTGYEIVYQGSPQVVGGTSAVAPLYAGLFAALGTKLGAIGPILWANRAAFVDIVSGDNGAFHAQVGPDPCTGLGAPNGAAIAALFAPAPTP